MRAIDSDEVGVGSSVRMESQKVKVGRSARW
jgi:hypothetical protein